MINSPEIRIGVIGAGDAAPCLAGDLLAAPGVKIDAVAEPELARREVFAARFGIARAFEDWRELLKVDGIDAVLILTPPHLHHPMAVASLQARKHVICEEPMARTVSECDAMLAAAGPTGRTLCITRSLRDCFFFRIASRLIGEGAIGRPVLGSFQWFADEAASIADPRSWKGTVDRAGGGVFMEGGSRLVDLANALFGPARRAAAMGKRLVSSLLDRGEDNGAFIIEYASGITCSFTLSFTAGAAYRGEGTGAGMLIDLYGTAGHLEGGFILRDSAFHPFCHEHRPGKEEVRHEPPEVPERAITRGIFRSIIDRTPPPVSALEARNAVAVIEAAYRSLRSGRIEDVDWRG